MRAYLEAKVSCCRFFRGTTNLILEDAGLRDIKFNIPFFLCLNEGDRLRFSQFSPSLSAERRVSVTHKDYQDVEIIRENEQASFLKLSAQAMRFLANFKKYYRC